MSAPFALPPALARLLDTLSAPLAEVRPVVADPRAQAIRSEIAKLSSHSGEAPDWSQIADHGVALLGDTGKDLLFAAYTAFALCKRHGLLGVHLGLSTFARLLAAPGLTPTHPSSRSKALEWYLGNLHAELLALRPAPADAPALRALPQALRALRSASAEALPDHPPNFSKVVQAADALCLELPDDSEPPAAPAPAASDTPAPAVAREPEPEPEPPPPAPSADPLEALRHSAAAWLAPLSPDPCGPDPSAHEAFTELRAEVQKTTAIVDNSVDWSKIEARSGELLQTLAKDLRIAAWFALARSRRAGLPGLLLGVVVAAELVTAHGAALHPRQPRARRLMAEWLFDQVARQLAAIRAPLAAPDFALLQAATERLTAALRDRFGDDAPSARPLREALQQLPRAEEPEAAEHEDPPEPPASGTPTSQPAPPLATPAPVPVQSAQVATPAPVDVAAPASVAAPADLAQLDAFLNNTDDALAQAARALREAQPGDPRGYRLLRVGLWLKLTAPPPVRPDGNTAIPGLPDRDREALDVLASKQQWLDLVHRSENLLRMHRLVLDLHRHSAAGLAGLGPDYAPAALALRAELACLLARLPALATLRDREGRPLADPDTQRWLSDHVLPRSRSAPAPAGDTDPEPDFWTELPARLRGDARDLALAEAQQRIDQSPSRRRRFTRGLALAEAAQGAGDERLAALLFSGLAAEAERAALDQWDPALVVRALTGAALLHHRRQDAAARDAALHRLTRLDAPAASILLAELR